MTTMIDTARLRLRTWEQDDGAAFIAATNTPAVMRWLGGVEADASAIRGTIERQQRHQAICGHCFWLIERKADGALLGFCGLQPSHVEPIRGEIEIGWRLREDAWGQGYAKEAAAACLDWAWASLDAARVVAITVLPNRASWGLMERLGMTRRPDLDFAHPSFPSDHELSAHIVYVAERPA